MKLKAVIKELNIIQDVVCWYDYEFLGWLVKVCNEDKTKTTLYTKEEVILLKSTGLKDSKGVEIFEGDIFEDIDAKYTIFWVKEKVGFRVLQEFFDSEYLTCDSDILEIGDFNFQKEELEIIGNIHTKENE